jgi:hypothetical protein
MWDPLLGPTIATVLGPEMSATRADGAGTTTVRPFAGTSAFDHVQVLAKTGGSGVWIADLTARSLKARPGDLISVQFGGKRPVELWVSGIYRALVLQPQTDYWQAWDSSIYPPCSDCSAPPPFVLADQTSLARLFEQLGVRSATYSWQAPLHARGPLTLDQARSLARFELEFEADAHSPTSEFRCCGNFAVFARCRTGYAELRCTPWRRLRNSASSGTLRPITLGSHQLATSISAAMPFVVSEVAGRVSGLEGSGQVLEVAAALVALSVIAAAGAFANAVRRVEALLRQRRPPWNRSLQASLGGLRD